jgi:hypothetical protein
MYRPGGSSCRSLSSTGAGGARPTPHEFASIFFAPVFNSALVLVGVLIGVLIGASGARAEDATGLRAHLTVRGIARIDAHVGRSHGKIVLRGTVTDDLGAATPGARIAVQLVGPGAPTTSLVPFGSGAPEACSDPGTTTAQILLEGPDRIVLPADATARFCVLLTIPPGRYVARLEARTSGFVDAARIEVPVDLSLAPVTLRFDGERSRLSLSLDDATTTLDVLASTEDDGVTAPAAGLTLHLANESGASIGEATTDPSGRARFVTPSARLGPAGNGELRVSFAGSAELGASSYVTEVERGTRVQIEAPDAVLGTLPVGSPESGITLRVIATPACRPRGCVGAPSGAVELRLGEDGAPSSAVVAAAPLEHGEARVHAVFLTPPGLGQVPLHVRYLSDSPWLQPLAPLSLMQPVRPPSPWSRIALATASLLVVAWLGAGRLAQVSRSGEPSLLSGRRSLVEEGAAPIELMRADPSWSRKWTGHIFDAHEGKAVDAARLVVERPGFRSTVIVAETVSDASGGFVLVSGDVLPGDRLVVEGPLHARVRMPMPPCGELKVTLIARRRALLDRLVTWARSRGRPFDAKPEPTPGHVRRAARMGEGGEAGIKEWAEAVERAAYGGGAVGAEAEAEVDRLAPKDASRDNDRPLAPKDASREIDRPLAPKDATRDNDRPLAPKDATRGHARGRKRDEE